MRKIVSGLLMGLLFVGCAKQETTYTIQGEWEGGDGKVVYLKKDLGDKKYEILDSAIAGRRGRTDFGHKWKYEYRYFGFYSNPCKMRNREKNGQRKRD